MKRIVIFSCACLLSIGAFAEKTAFVGMKLTSASGGVSSVRLNEESTASNGFVDGVESPKNMSLANSKSVLLFGIVDDIYCEGLYDNNLEGRKIGFVTNQRDEDYTITFTTVTGRSLKFVDHFGILEDGVYNDSIMDIVEGGIYAFKAEKEDTVLNRFQIYMPVEPTICHQYGELLITGHIGDKVKVLDMDGEVAIAEQTIIRDSKVISLSALTSGEQYQVIVGDKTMIIRVQ